MPLDKIEKRETEQIKVKMPNGTNFGMAAFVYKTNKEYLIHIIAILHFIEKKGLASDIKVTWDSILELQREMKPYFQFPKDRTEAVKEIRKQTLSEYKEILKAKKGFALPKPKRHTRCSVAQLLAIRELSGTRLSMKCTPRTPELA